MYPEPIADPAPPEAALPASPPDRTITHDGDPGVLAFVDAERIVRFASDCDGIVELVPRIGEFLPTGAVLFRVWGQADIQARCRAAIVIERRIVLSLEASSGLIDVVRFDAQPQSPSTTETR